MTWNLALGTLVVMFMVATLLTLWSRRFNRGESAHPIKDYLLAGASLERIPVVSLLLSSSFGLNALFYQVWLGFTVGAYGLIFQIAWAVSFALLAPFSNTIRKHRSLHEFLGTQFGPTTRFIAGLCSLVGIMYLMGWEVEVGREMLSGILELDGAVSVQQSTMAATWLMGGLVFGCLMYTLLGGLKGNAYADLALNGLKLVAVCLVTYWLFKHGMPTGSSFWDALRPSFATVHEKLGWWGLITNIAFSLVWQFVDTSSWQSIIAGKKDDDAASNLQWSAWVVFLAPGIIGTLLGAALVGVPDITQENILTKAVALALGLSLVISFVMTFACVMSLVDGLFLAAAFTLVIDMFHPGKSLESLEEDRDKAERRLLAVRVALVVIAVIAVLCVRLLREWLGAGLFDFVYVVIITQLALFGPVFIALTSRHRVPYPLWLTRWLAPLGFFRLVFPGLTAREPRYRLWLAIGLALVVGFGSIIVGTKLNLTYLVEGAGTFTIVASYLTAFWATKPAAVHRAEG